MRIEAHSLRFSYNKRLPAVLDGLSAAFETGNVYFLIGENGSGKTTFGKLLLGLLKPSSGSILFDGENAVKISAGERAARIGYLFQNPDMQLFAPTVIQELTFPYEITEQLIDTKLTELKALLKMFNLDNLEQRFPLTLSVGEKQRLALATIMSRNIEFLILDEPTSAIDKPGKTFLIEIIKDFIAKGGGALIITHDEELLSELPDSNIIRIKKGKAYEN